MTRHACAVGFVIVCLTAVSAQHIDINGRVTDRASGAGIAGASVVLLGKALWVTTATDGSFHIDWSSPVLPSPSRRAVAAPECMDGRLLFGVARAGTRVRAELYGLDGRRERVLMDDALRAGSYQVDLGTCGQATGLRLLTLQIGERAYVVKYGPGMGRTARRLAEAHAGGLAKSGTTIVDTLAVTCTGYRSAQVMLTGYVVTEDISLEKAVRVQFSINHGAATVARRENLLVYVDSSRSTASLRFTQIADSIGPVLGPHFDAPDTANPVGPITVGPHDQVEVPWVLLGGPGSKRVYAEITWYDTARGVDTIWTEVDIAPWHMNVTVRNTRQVYVPDSYSSVAGSRSGPDDAEVVYWHTEGSQGLSGYDYYTFGVPSVLFSIDVGGDSTFYDAFECWLVAAAGVNELFQTVHSNPDDYWLETHSRAFGFAGGGAWVDPSHVYGYSIDTATDEGRHALSRLRQLTDTRRYPYGASTTDITGPPDSLFRAFTRLASSEIVATGRKQFGLVIYTGGRYFNEPRSYVSFFPEQTGTDGSGVAITTYRSMWFDFIPPRVQLLSSTDTAFLGSGDTVGASFDVVLDGGSVLDGGRSVVKRVELLIAPKPAGLVWDYADVAGTLSALSLGGLLAGTHELLPYPVPDQPRHTVNDVAWRSISTVGWPAGEYVVGVVTADAFGNTGLAPCAIGTGGRSSNPFLVTVLSGS